MMLQIKFKSVGVVGRAERGVKSVRDAQRCCVPFGANQRCASQPVFHRKVSHDGLPQVKGELACHVCWLWGGGGCERVAGDAAAKLNSSVSVLAWLAC